MLSCKLRPGIHTSVCMKLKGYAVGHDAPMDNLEAGGRGRRRESKKEKKEKRDTERD